MTRQERILAFFEAFSRNSIVEACSHMTLLDTDLAIKLLDAYFAHVRFEILHKNESDPTLEQAYMSVFRECHAKVIGEL